ncbi:MAG: succinate dehydrogenase, cytochrome b556 subunit [Casimicrobiaceae bacterium]|nr:succinate dehydrogenase, cytochrome b556 subunit [Casimicrobiaceae bacterium]MCX8099263.1 succinate dehydrogenase, cytochrome b556 subunit [Casimicrobiaceae bacterium]MDW8312808.1 succinate dehydrogenase, cytochrome b556 subunit [Burkholderiales bacterium]
MFRNVGLFDLLRYRLPVPGLASILHRISGVVLFLGMLLVLPLLQMSLASEAGFEAVRSAVWGHPLGKLALLALLLATLYHLLAGLRHLVQDANYWLEPGASRRSAWLTIGVSVLLTAVVALRLG